MKTHLFFCLIICTSFSLAYSQISPCDSMFFSEDFNSSLPDMVIDGWTGDFDTSLGFNEGWVIESEASTVTHANPNDPTGPNSAFEGSQYMYYETSGPAPNDSRAIIQTPKFLIKSKNSSLSFYLYLHGSQIEYLKVNAVTNNGVDLLQMFSEEIQTSKSDPWHQVIINLSDYTNDSLQIEFQGKKDGGNLGDIAIDLVEVCFENDSTPIPTLDQWGIILLVLSLNITAAVFIINLQSKVDFMNDGSNVL